jgi:hypothetical protein
LRERINLQAAQIRDGLLLIPNERTELFQNAPS